MAARLVDWQRVHVGAKPDRPIAGARSQDADNPDTFMHLKAKVAQQPGNLCPGLMFLKAKLGQAVKPAPQLGQLVAIDIQIFLADCRIATVYGQTGQVQAIGIVWAAKDRCKANRHPGLRQSRRWKLQHGIRRICVLETGKDARSHGYFKKGGMKDQHMAATESDAAPQHFDVLIAGAGISGIAAGYHLQTQSPQSTFLILEAQETFGGTWTTHRYPGIRSDSDLYTFGYRFKPWIGPPIATAAEILTYLGEVIDENDLARRIRYRHRIVTASWSSADNLWTLEAVRTDTGERLQFTASFLWMCQGYYRHSEGYTPDWPGMDDFSGKIVHPQTWPEDLDFTDKSVVVIGSGATAATLVPALAGKCAHVTMLQRSPTYFNIRPNVNELAETLREIGIEEDLIHQIVRKQIVFDQKAFATRCFEDPDGAKADLMALLRAYITDEDLIRKHFTPRYLPWRQRVAMIPDGDLFRAVRKGTASVVTDEIERFTESGLSLKSGEDLQADIIVTATGFNLCALGDIAFSIDGKALDFSETVTYRGMMFTGVPNMVWVFGYFRYSWTLRSELIADFVCRLLNDMSKKSAKRVEVALRKEDDGMNLLPWMDPENFNPGYLMRGMHLLPKSGNKPEWQHNQDYWSEKDVFPDIDLDDDVFVYDGSRGCR